MGTCQTTRSITSFDRYNFKIRSIKHQAILSSLYYAKQTQKNSKRGKMENYKTKIKNIKTEKRQNGKRKLKTS